MGRRNISGCGTPKIYFLYDCYIHTVSGWGTITHWHSGRRRLRFTPSRKRYVLCKCHLWGDLSDSTTICTRYRALDPIYHIVYSFFTAVLFNGFAG